MNQKERVRGVLLERMKMGKPIDALLNLLRVERPSTLIDITIDSIPLVELNAGSFASVDSNRNAIGFFPIAPQHFYQRLAEGSGDAKLELLETVVSMHPQESWICILSQQIEGLDAGKSHLMAIHEQPYFYEICVQYAQSGMRNGLLYCSQSLGRVEPALALLQEGTLESGLHAGAPALSRNPSCGMIEYLAALLGP